MNEYLFEIDERIINDALKRGIKIKKDNMFIEVFGVNALVFMPQLNKYIITYGTNQTDGGYVMVDEYNHTWITK